MNDRLKNFINENIDLINANTKESWEEIYKRLKSNNDLKGKFTEMILDAGINDPASIMGYIPTCYFVNSSIQNYNIPSNVISIGDYAFEKCDSLTSIMIGDSVTRIDDHAFFTCFNLMNVTIKGNVQSIGAFAFAGCAHLTDVFISGNVTSVEDYAFYYCENLREIQFDGTKEQAIKCGIGDSNREVLREKSAIQKIICIDGEILL